MEGQQVGQRAQLSVLGGGGPRERAQVAALLGRQRKLAVAGDLATVQRGEHVPVPRALEYHLLYDLGMSAERISVTMESAVASEAKQRAGRRGFSAYVTEAVRRRLQAERLEALLLELEAEHGPIPEDVQAEVDRVWRHASSLTQAR